MKSSIAGKAGSTCLLFVLVDLLVMRLSAVKYPVLSVKLVPLANKWV